MKVSNSFVRITLTIILSVLQTACNQSKATITKIQVNMEKAISAEVEDVFSHISYLAIELPDSIYFGNIEHIKSSGKYLFLHDLQQTESITVIDTLGNFINQLKRKERGPSEYMDMESFAFDKNQNELIINDRTLKQFQFYSFPDLEHVRTARKNQYITNFEILDDDHWLVISDESNEKMEYAGLEIWDRELDLLYRPKNINNDISSIEISYPNTITNIGSVVLYANPGEITTIFEINGQQQIEKYGIDFGKNKILNQVYSGRIDAQNFETVFEELPHKATWGQNVLIHDPYLSFWNMYRDFETFYFSVYNTSNNKSVVYSDLKFRDSEVKLPRPIGMVDGKYISYLYPDEIESIRHENKYLKSAIKKNNGSETPILIIFKL